MSHAKCRVLIVEDDRDAREAFTTMLMRLGHEVIGVATAGEALLFVRASAPPFDALILDIVLPDESGIEILREVRQREMPMKVAVVTALDQSRCATQLQALRPELVLRKPVDAYALAGWIASCRPAQR